MKDYYKILEVSKDASTDEIKTSYRTLSKKCHPDGSEPDEERFKECAEAWAVLRDVRKRALYDHGKYNPEEDIDNLDLSEDEMDVLLLFEQHISKNLADTDISLNEVYELIQTDIIAAKHAYRDNLTGLEVKLTFLKRFIFNGVFHKKEVTKHNLALMALTSSIQQCEVEILNLKEEINHSDRLLKLLKDFHKPQSYDHWRIAADAFSTRRLLKKPDIY